MNQRSCSRVPTSSAGTTLIELMMAVMILGLLFGGAITTLGRGFFEIELSRDSVRVTQLLQSEVELLRTQNWTQLEALKGTSTVSLELDSSGDPIFGGKYTLTRALTTSKVDQLQLSLKANWTDSRGISHDRTFYTIFTKDGLNDYYYRTI